MVAQAVSCRRLLPDPGSVVLMRATAGEASTGALAAAETPRGSGLCGRGRPPSRRRLWLGRLGGFRKDGEEKHDAGQKAAGWAALDARQITLGALHAALPVRVSLFVSGPEQCQDLRVAPTHSRASAGLRDDLADLGLGHQPLTGARTDSHRPCSLVLSETVADQL